MTVHVLAMITAKPGQRATILADGDTIGTDAILLEPSTARQGAATVGPRPLVELERDAIASALQAVSGNRRRAAELLGIAERTLYDKLKRYGLE